MARRGIELLGVYTGGSQVQKPYNELTWEGARCRGNPIPLLSRAGFSFLLHLVGAPLPSTLLEKDRVW